jgi:hypothetical protein
VGPRSTTTRSSAVLAVAALVLGATAAPSALAHSGGDPNLETLARDTVPHLDGVRVGVVSSLATEVTVANRGRGPVEVLDGHGRPFLRIGPRGTEADVAAPAWYRSNGPAGAVSVSPRIREDAPPVWRRVSRRASWAFFDSRVPEVQGVDPKVRAAGELKRLRSWSIPLRQGRVRSRIAGEVQYRPVLGGPVAKLTGGAQVAPGVAMALVDGKAPALFLQSSGRETVMVQGRDGEPFAQIGPRGTRVNLRSPTHAADAAAQGQKAGAPSDADAPPLWRHVSAQPSYEWIDPRTSYDGGVPPREVLAAPGPSRLRGFTVPLKVGSQMAKATGTISWVPAPGARKALASETARGGGGPPALLAIGGPLLLVLLGAAAATLLSRRRRSRDDLVAR